MSKGKISLIIGALFIFFSLTITSAYSYDDGFGSARKVEGKHFVLYYSPHLDATSLLRKLNITPYDKLLAGKSTNKKLDDDQELADALDTLFILVSDILDIHLYSLQGKIKVCQDYNQLSKLYNALFDGDLKKQKSFYVHRLKTIYISSENLSAEVLGHEIAHLVISNYFVVPPPLRVQEVLAGYVEYQLRKKNTK